MTIEQAIEQYENSERMNKELAETSVYPTVKVYYLESAEKCRQMIEWLRELQDRRAEPEIVECYECKHYIPVSPTSNSWGKCSVHSSPTEKQRTCQSCD
jgi:hypothetical protein